MIYIYMDNFRGFSKTLMPLEQITFFVGENSTGKSSVLKLLSAFSAPTVIVQPDKALQEDATLGGFEDMVSANAQDRTYFNVALVSTEQDKENDAITLEYSLMSFSDQDGLPILSNFTYSKEGTRLKLVFKPKIRKYKIEKEQNIFEKEEEALKYFKRTAMAKNIGYRGYDTVPKELPRGLPLGYLIGSLKNLDRKKIKEGKSYEFVVPWAFDLTNIAPIRSKPQRYYDALRKEFSPSGDHVHNLLKRTLKLRTKSQEFSERLEKFGNLSGLFETVKPHSFGQSAQAPFELLVRLNDIDLNITNVGYGVCQVLPLIVEMLISENNADFAIQQPEIHLHPKAQAALGDLIYTLAKEKQCGYFIETHSDYIIDRIRLCIKKDKRPLKTQVVFFKRYAGGNKAYVLKIDSDGRYPEDQPSEFRDFFIKEEITLLEL